jgi:hypothetical protein
MEPPYSLVHFNEEEKEYPEEREEISRSLFIINKFAFVFDSKIIEMKIYMVTLLW